jgi:general L-amino acid transport system permease protein
MATGQQFPVLWTSVALIIGFPLLGYLLAGFPISLDFQRPAIST